MFAPTVRDIQQFTKKPRTLLTVKETDTVAKAAQRMRKNGVGCLVVLNGNRQLVGIVTERDMLAKVFTRRSSSPGTLQVKDIMTARPIFCAMDTPLEEVERIMAEHKIRHLPVIEGGKPVAMVSGRDLITYRLQASKSMRMAAEQLALLSTRLKSLNLDDVVNLAINEVPKNFGAECAMLCIPSDKGLPTKVYRKGCPLPKDQIQKLTENKNLRRNRKILYLTEPDTRHQPACSLPKLIIPLTFYTKTASKQGDLGAQTIKSKCAQTCAKNLASLGLLCICGVDPAAFSQQLGLYKASLLQQLLNANLTSAELYKNYQEARRESEIDSLTKVGSRRILEQALNSEYARAVRYNRPFSVAIIDIDHFKHINDTAGHAAGDKVLQRVAKVMRRNIRTTDAIIVRYGGDEFVLIMPETRLSEAVVLAERLRKQVGKIRMSNIGAITLSCGVTEWSGSSEDNPKSIMSRADDALYQAKRAGRDQVVTSNGVVVCS